VEVSESVSAPLPRRPDSVDEIGACGLNRAEHVLEHRFVARPPGNIRKRPFPGINPKACADNIGDTFGDAFILSTTIDLRDMVPELVGKRLGFLSLEALPHHNALALQLVVPHGLAGEVLRRLHLDRATFLFCHLGETIPELGSGFAFKRWYIKRWERF